MVGIAARNCVILSRTLAGACGGVRLLAQGGVKFASVPVVSRLPEH